MKEYQEVALKWRQKDKYAVIIKEFHHSQIKKHNGTSGHPVMTKDNIGVFNERTGMYDFKETVCAFTGRKVTPCFLEEFVLYFKHIFKTVDSFLEIPNDEDEKRITERFEIRLFKAKTQIAVNVAKMFYEAAQIDRLSIKASVMRLNQIK